MQHLNKDNLWAAGAGGADIYPPLPKAKRVDVAVVGAGFTGLSAAYHLARGGRSVCVLDAAQPGHGASGRNGGQVNPGWKILPETILQRYGRDRGEKILAMLAKVCDLVFDLIDEHDMDCEAVRPGYVQGGFGKRGLRPTRLWVEQWGRYAAGARVLDAGEIRDLLGGTDYDGGMIDPRGGHVQPLAYARALAAAAAGAGALIHGDCTVTGIRRQAGRWRLVTPMADLDAAQVLLATNGYTDDLWPGLRENVIPVTSVVSATAPMAAALAKSILPGGHAVSESRRMMVYYRKDADGRFVIGGRGDLFGKGDTIACHRQIRREAVRLFPQLAGLEWDFAWSGVLALTMEKTPRLLRLDDGVHAGLGYYGRGIAMATMMGKQLAAVAMGREADLPLQNSRPAALHRWHKMGIVWHLLSGPVLDRLERHF